MERAEDNSMAKMSVNARNFVTVNRTWRLSKRAGDLFAALDVADIPYALFQRSQVLFNRVRQMFESV
jgi:hypothetical protein